MIFFTLFLFLCFAHFLFVAPFCQAQSDLSGRSDKKQLAPWLTAFALSLLVSLTAGCGGQSIPPPPQMTLQIKPELTANKGKVFYMLVRSTNEKQYLTETYVNIATLVFADPPDPSVLGVFPIFPGQERTIEVMQPSQNPVAFYFLFTEASEHWRQIINQPLATTYIIHIQEDVVWINEKKSFWAIFF